MRNRTYITMQEINKILDLDKNTTRARKLILNYLKLQKAESLIDYTFAEDNIRNNTFIEVEWINNFPNKNDSGWMTFYSDDFEILYSIGVDFYVVHWVLRMYVNHEKGFSYISIKDIASILTCRTVAVQNAIDLFDYSGLFKIKRGEYYYNYDMKRMAKNNNEYKYTSEKNWILKLGRF